jgi:hypothetical protein
MIAALQEVKTTTAERIMRDGFEAMVRGFAPQSNAQAVGQSADAELSLLPRELRVGRGECAQFLKSQVMGR